MGEFFKVYAVLGVFLIPLYKVFHQMVAGAMHFAVSADTGSH